MMEKKFDKKLFKAEVTGAVKNLFRKELEEATPEQIFQGVSAVVKEWIVDDWIKCHKAVKDQDAKIVYYLSMEFLEGRALGNNLINLSKDKEVREALAELGVDLNEIENQEPDPALGNGGLGRLRHPLQIRPLQTEDRKRLPGGKTRRLAEKRISL